MILLKYIEKQYQVYHEAQDQKADQKKVSGM